ncbi:GNAT family N-acetyltransferase [Lentzea alba]|uniref:GNAT family N-acetyltransferase n=1 Tax=Lentzea alba TaxID=2714351 RepID=UPI0039BF52E1
MQIHRVTSDEWDLWRDLRLEALACDPGGFGSTLAREQAFTEDYWRESVGRGLKLVALAPGPAGLVGAFADSVGLQLYSMWVRDTHRGRGVGEALVKTVLEWAAEHGWKVVRLRVYDHNLPARRLYERLGFTKAAEPEFMEFQVS